MRRAKPTYAQLKKIWDERLAREGLPEIESRDHRLIDHLTVGDLYELTGFMRTDIMEAIRDYYTWAEQCLMICRFQRASDRKIWVMHAEGSTTREIARALQVHQMTIWRAIRRIRAYLQIQTG